MHYRLALVIVLSAHIAGCGGDDGGDFFSPPDLDPDGTSYTYVVDSLVIPSSPSEAVDLGLDLDGDDQSDNQLGRALATAASFSGEVDLQGAVDEGVASGATILLAELQTTSLANATGAGIFLRLGDNPSNAPCTGPGDTVCGGHLDGATSFDIAASSPQDALVTGNVAGARFRGGPGALTVELTVVEGAAPLTLNLIGARIDVSASESALSMGRLAGGLTETEVTESALPAVADILQLVASDDCQGEAPNCCTPETSGFDIIEIFDANDDCQVTVDEISDNPILANFLSPDLDLLDGDGNFNPGSDGILDSLSIGVGFSAVGATF